MSELTQKTIDELFLPASGSKISGEFVFIQEGEKHSVDSSASCGGSCAAGSCR